MPTPWCIRPGINVHKIERWQGSKPCQCLIIGEFKEITKNGNCLFTESSGQLFSAQDQFRGFISFLFGERQQVVARFQHRIAVGLQVSAVA